MCWKCVATFFVVSSLGLTSLVACRRDEPEAASPEIATETPPGPTPGSSTISTSDLTFGRAVGPDKRVTDETTTFSPSDRIYVSFELQGNGGTANTAADWIYQDGQIVSRSARTVPVQGTQAFEFHVTKPRGWAVGNYEVVVRLDGREIHRKSFTVGP